MKLTKGEKVAHHLNWREYPMIQNRVSKVVGKMKEMGLDYLVVSDHFSVHYLLGKTFHTGERMMALVLDTEGKGKFFMNQLFPFTDDLGVEVHWFTDTEDCVEVLANQLPKTGVIGIDKNWPARFVLRLQELKNEMKYVNGSNAVDRVRMQKDEVEKDRMRASSLMNDAAMVELKKLVPAGLTELQMQKELEGIYAKLGADGFSFTPIICYGKGGSEPHHDNNNATVEAGDAVILDIGCVLEDYCSDMTRTVFYKSVSEEGRKVYELVKEANLAAIAAVKPGARFCDIDNAARSVIEAGGYGPRFLHRTGHSIGLEVHDFGDVSSTNTDELKPGMIFSIEPGIYVEGKFGVRIEDLVLVTEDGCEVLNKHSKELEIIG